MGASWVPVILNGPGRVGTNFVRLLREKTSYIKARCGILPVLVAVVDLGRSILVPGGLSAEYVHQWITDPQWKTDNQWNTSDGLKADDRGKTANHRKADDRWKGDGVPFYDLTYPDILDAVLKKSSSPCLPGIVVEATPTDLVTGEPGLGHITLALGRGFSVVTLAKGPLVLACRELRSLAARNSASLRYSGAAAAALPTVDTAVYSMAGADIVEIEGVLNGTTNYILNSMADGKDYDEALDEARKIGVAEADPTLDVLGFDSAAKLLILANTVWDRDLQLGDVLRHGITQITGETVALCAREGTPMRLVARATCDDSLGGVVQMTVGPETIPPGHPFVNLPGTQKAVRYVSRQMGEIVVSGGASDVAGAAAAALKDLIHILDDVRARTGA